MDFRIVVNIGDVLVEGSQIYGEGVNVAARLTPSPKSVHLVLEKSGLLMLLCKFHRSARSASPLTWAQRLKRVFGIDVQTCAGCGGTMRIIACIEDPVVIKAILAHLAGKAYSALPRLPPGRAPPAPVVS